MLTRAQKRQFAEEGYLRISGVVPQVMVDAARRAINHSIGHVGMSGENPEKYQVASLCNELKNAPVILDLFNKTPVIPIAESLIGQGDVLPVGGAQLALRFPGSSEGDLPEPRGHLDGLGTGTNGMAKGVYRRGFTAFAVIYLSDVPEPFCGNFTVWPKSHRFFEDYFKREGHAVLTNGMPRVDLPEGPVMVTGKAGDFIIAHHQLVHTGGPNTSPNVRYATIARLQHKTCKQNEYEAFTDIWREWAGVRETLQPA